MRLYEFLDYMSWSAERDGILVFREVDNDGNVNDSFCTYPDRCYTFEIRSGWSPSDVEYPSETELHIIPDDNGTYLYADDVLSALEYHRDNGGKYSKNTEFHIVLHDVNNPYQERDYIFGEMTGCQIRNVGNNEFEINYSLGKTFLRHFGRAFGRGGYL